MWCSKIFLKYNPRSGATQLLGIRNSEEVEENELVSKNIRSTLLTLAKKWSWDGKSAHRALLIGVTTTIASNRLISMESRAYITSRKSLWRDNKFRIQLDENDELSSWANIYRQPYQDRLPNNVRDKVNDFLNLNSLMSPNEMDIVLHHISRGNYGIHAKHII